MTVNAYFRRPFFQILTATLLASSATPALSQESSTPENNGQLSSPQAAAVLGDQLLEVERRDGACGRR